LWETKVKISLLVVFWRSWGSGTLRYRGASMTALSVHSVPPRGVSSHSETSGTTSWPSIPTSGASAAATAGITIMMVRAMMPVGRRKRSNRWVRLALSPSIHDIILAHWNGILFTASSVEGPGNKLVGCILDGVNVPSQ
jgi:hypothetical protein